RLTKSKLPSLSLRNPLHFMDRFLCLPLFPTALFSVGKLCVRSLFPNPLEKFLEFKMMLPLSERDRSLIWHPFTQEKTAPLPLAIARAKGSYLYDTEDKAYLDLISSWWVTLHGHAHPVIARHIYAQALR